jgi:hypothetical protein
VVPRRQILGDVLIILAQIHDGGKKLGHAVFEEGRVPLKPWNFMESNVLWFTLAKFSNLEDLYEIAKREGVVV